LDVENGSVEWRIQEWCLHYFAEICKLELRKINVNATFSRLGMDSAARIFCLVAIEEWLQIQLPSDLIFENDTIAELAHSLARRSDVAQAIDRRVHRGISSTR
jgi:acyl carrier protein